LECINLLLIDLMALHELEETIELLRFKLINSAAENGFSNNRTVQISQTLDLYLSRYKKLKDHNKMS
jgi:hypothetical protein